MRNSSGDTSSLLRGVRKVRRMKRPIKLTLRQICSVFFDKGGRFTQRRRCSGRSIEEEPHSRRGPALGRNRQAEIGSWDKGVQPEQALEPRAC